MTSRRPRPPSGGWTRLPLVAGAAGAAALAVHTAVNTRLLRVPPAARAVDELVSVLLPMRDEADHAAPCLRAVQASVELPHLEIIVYDDASTDGTGDVARELAGGDSRVRVMDGSDLPAGWLGKPHACARLAGQARGSVLVFVDTDVTVAPDGIARTVGLLREHGLDLVSPYPRQDAVTVAERLVQPLLQWSWLALLPLRLAERSPRPSLSAANGQLLCVDAAAYRRAGGHAGVRDAVLEDIALLRAVKTAGGHGVVADGTDIARTRMYRGWPALRDGYAKSLWAGGGSVGASAGQVGVLTWLFVLPAVAMLRGSRMGLAGYGAGVAGRMVAARRTGGRAWPDALAHPLSIGMFGYLTALSWVRRRRGTAIWKGRPLAEPPPAVGGNRRYGNGNDLRFHREAPEPQ
ncbi:glycosyltransferase family 2 protein [Frankia sp. Cppng1_Ct_nod]|uniref:glycosyltransferase n=1 Tax=Frankia sp. Cppng1_Ct_nod TaxID=2897162 RepID=UPI001040E7CA|nr:glycosyltransferase family 2 protein [Frankia sp. Cppng1_Ct_nod]